MGEAELPNYITITHEQPASYWCKLLDCSEEDLMHALNTIGFSYAFVDSYLSLNRRKKSDLPR